MKVTYTNNYIRIGPFSTKAEAASVKSSFRSGFLVEESERQFLKLKDKLLINFMNDRVAESIKLLSKLRPILTKILILDYLSFIPDKLEIKVNKSGQFFLYAYHLAQV